MTTPILITGAGGWLGRGLVHAIVEGLPDGPDLSWAVGDGPLRCLLPPGENGGTLEELSSRVELVVGDLRDPGAMARFCQGAEGAVLFHIAGLIHPALLTRDFTAVNVRGSENLLAAATRSGIRRAVIMSSNSPLGTNPDRKHRFDESSPYNPYMGYGRSKKQLEELVARIRSHAAMETVVVRAPWFYGPFQPPRQSEFFTMIRTGRVPIIGDGGNLRSMAYIDNLSHGLLLCAGKAEADGETYWIADERPYSMNEIVDTIERVMRDDFHIAVSGKRMRLPNVVSEIAWAGDWLLQSAGLYVQRVHVLSEMNKNIACDIGKARRELGYDPKVGLEEGMRRSMRWCLGSGIKF